MPRYLSLFKYSVDGTKGFLKDKATAREAAVRTAVESVGGRLELLNWTGSGEYTGIAISHLPNNAIGAAFIAMVEGSGAFSEFKAIELLTSGEMDDALGKAIKYRPPGG
jgi:uncharacterized protein with GYD domain